MKRLLIICLAFILAAPAYADSTDTINTTIKTKSGKEVHLKLEIAATPDTRHSGLMNRDTIGPHDGMAFWFPQIWVKAHSTITKNPSPIFAPQKFWMKDTKIPLDILFMDASNKIIYIGHGKPLSEDAVGPEGPVASVIEIAGGRAKKEGITVGDSVHYEIETDPSHLAR